MQDTDTNVEKKIPVPIWIVALLGVGLCFLLVVLGLLYALHSLEVQTLGGHQLDLAGRQRMLCERYMRLSLLVGRPNSQQEREKLLLRTTVEAALSGGKVYPRLTSKTMHATVSWPGVHNKRLLQRHYRALERMFAEQHRYFKALNTTSSQRAKREFVKSGLFAVQTADKVVEELSLFFSRRLHRSKQIIFFTLSVAMLLFLLASFSLYSANRKMISTNQKAHHQATLYQSIFETILDGLIVADERGKIEQCNQTAERIFGYDEGELLGKSVISIFSPVDGVQQPEADKLKRGELHEAAGLRETNGMHKDGTAFPVELATVRLHVGERVMFLGAIRDLSERKQYEDALQDWKERMEIATASAGIGVWEWDFETEEMVWNDQMYKHYGISADLFPSSYELWCAGVHPDERDSFVKTMNDARDGLSDIDTEFRVLLPDQVERFFKMYAVVVRDEDGKGVRMIGTQWDISSSHQAILLEERLQIERVFSQLMLTFVQTGENDPVENALDVLREVGGYRPVALYQFDEWEGALSLRCALGLGTDVKMTYIMGEGLVGEAALKREPIFWESVPNRTFQLNTGVGVFETTHIFAIPLIYKEILLGVLVGTSGYEFSERSKKWLIQVGTQISVGLSTLRQHEQLKKLTSQLNTRNRQIALQNEELSHANRMKSEFLASMSHELRTPLNAIIGFSEILKDEVLGELSKQQLDYVSEIFKSGHHLLSLINDILDLSKVEAGKMELFLERVELKGFIASTLSVVKESAMKKDIELVYEVDSALSHVEVDARKMRQIVYNLLSNAVKFTPEGGHVSVEVKPYKERFFEVSVSDTGIGIEEEHFGRLFRPFEQLDGGMNREYEGTGLGLALVKRLTTLHGGEVGLESQPGRGSRFWVHIPCDQSSEVVKTHIAEDVVSHALEMKEAYSSSEAISPLAVVVCQDPDSQELIRLYLQDVGIEVIFFPDTASALTHAYKRQPHFMILDLHISGQLDPDFYTEVAQSEQLRGLPIIVVCADEHVNVINGIGAFAVLAKPLRRKEMLEIVDKILCSRKTGCILVVDDDPNALSIISSYFEGKPYDIRTADGGAEALAMVHEEPPDLVLLDLMMPEIDGFEVLKRLRADQRTLHLPVIILTAKQLSQGERLLLKQQTQGLFSKASTAGSDIVKYIETWFGYKPSKRPLP